MTATVAQGKDEDYYDQEEVKQDKTKKGRKDIENYLSEEGHSLGLFYGLGVNEIGLLNGVTEKGDLRTMLRGVHPRTGEQMFKQRKSKSQFTDICFSAPKDFSLVAELDEENMEVYEAIQIRSVKRALDKLQPKLYRRKNSKNEKEFKMKPIHLLYNHKTARPLADRRPDMQWHTHCPTLRMGLNQNNEWRVIDNFPMFNNQKLLGAEYRVELANGLREMGFEVIPTIEEVEEDNGRGGFKRVKVSSFKIKGITKSQRDMFSARSLEINQKSKPGATALDKYNTAQNIKRTKVQWDEKELKAIWKKDAESVGLTKDFIRRMKTHNDNSFEFSKPEEVLIASAMRKGKLFEIVLDLKLVENEQNTGIPAEALKKHLIDNKFIEPINGFEFKVNVDVSNYLAKNKAFKHKIKIDSKVYEKKFKEHKESLKSNEFKPLSDKVKQQVKEALNSSNLVKFKDKKEAINNIVNNFGLANTIQALGIKLGLLKAQLFNLSISDEDKAKIQKQIIRIQQEIEELKIKELNKPKFN